MVEDNRRTRYAGRIALRSITTVERCGDCGRKSVTSGGLVGVRVSEGRAGYAGLSTCGRVWLCPVCNSKIMARRSLEIAQALQYAHDHGYLVIWGSLTCWHNSASRLQGLLDVQRAGWRYVTQSRAWTDTATDRLGYIRASELTVGINGWHPHFHPLIVWKGTRRAAEAFSSVVEARWIRGIVRAGGIAKAGGAQQLEVLSPGEGFDRLASYVTKAVYQPSKLALEAVWSQSKTGRGRVKETVSHWVLLAAVQQGLADEAHLWWELEKATTGHRALTWSRKLRELVGIGAESTDEEVAAEERGALEDTVCFITPAGWRLMRDSAGLTSGALRALEVGGFASLQAFLVEAGVDWVTFDELHPH